MAQTNIIVLEYLVRVVAKGLISGTEIIGKTVRYVQYKF